MTEKNKAVRRVEKLLQKQGNVGTKQRSTSARLLYAVRILPARSSNTGLACLLVSDGQELENDSGKAAEQR